MDIQDFYNEGWEETDLNIVNGIGFTIMKKGNNLLAINKKHSKLEGIGVKRQPSFNNYLLMMSAPKVNTIEKLKKL
jgi:hypothetical protein